MEEEEEAPELISPRISFSHDLANFTAPPRWSDSSLLTSPSPSAARLPEPEFDFANADAAAAADVAPADRLFAGGKLLPMPPLPPAPRPSPCKQEPSSGGDGGGGGGGVKAAAPVACPQKRPGSWRASPFSRSSSVNSATTAAGAPRSAGRFGCPPFPLMRSWSASAAVARNGSAAVPDAAGGSHRPRYYKKFGGAVAPAGNGGGGGSSRGYYYGGGRKGGGHGVRVSPVLNVPFIGTSVANVLSYLLCDCSTTKNKKNREF
ncbi:unnamed protein product [Urochloa decumbens]|uniref:Uncharacterized protein n=1 Tax=Urochloa decumbens TaxID=240449 RepID=A0ABC9AF88_9POAL